MRCDASGTPTMVQENSPIKTVSFGKEYHHHHHHVPEGLGVFPVP